jgi:hypothetical protein
VFWQRFSLWITDGIHDVTGLARLGESRYIHTTMFFDRTTSVLPNISLLNAGLLLTVSLRVAR